MAHLLYQNPCIVIGYCKQYIIPVQVFGSYTPVKIIVPLNKAIETVDCIQVKKFFSSSVRLWQSFTVQPVIAERLW
jgi:hypothetical protein